MSIANRIRGWHPGASMHAMGAKGAVLFVFVVAMLIALPMTSASAATVLMVGGMNQSTLDDYTMSLALDGKFTGNDPSSRTPWQRVSVNWPAEVAPYWGNLSLAESVAEGTANLLEAIKATYESTPGPITVLGTSAGTLVVDEAMRALAADPDAPPPGSINFVVLADATQRIPAGGWVWNPFATLSGYTYQEPPQTSYDLTVVTYEYDGWADWPDRPWNLLAVSNAVVGGFLLHAATWFVDLSEIPASDITVTTNEQNGVTTSYLVRAETLPLVQLFPQLASQEDSLRQQIDAAYTRNDQTTDSSSSSIEETEETDSTETASEETASPETASDPPSSASAIDPLAGAATKSVEESQSEQAVDNATVEAAKAAPLAEPQLENTAQALGDLATDLTGGTNVQASTNSAIAGLPGKAKLESAPDTATKEVQNANNGLGGLAGAGTPQAQTAGAAGGGADSGE